MRVRETPPPVPLTEMKLLIAKLDGTGHSTLQGLVGVAVVVGTDFELAG